MQTLVVLVEFVVIPRIGGSALDSLLLEVHQSTSIRFASESCMRHEISVDGRENRIDSGDPELKVVRTLDASSLLFRLLTSLTLPGAANPSAELIEKSEDSLGRLSPSRLVDTAGNSPAR